METHSQTNVGSPADALRTLAAQLRGEDSVVSPSVIEPRGTATLGELAAAGPGAREAPATYALVIEAVREGYLLHYGGTPRVVDTPDRDLALLAGDYLYAVGLERLAGLGDLVAIHELSELISLSAQLHAEQRDPAEARALWLASATALSAGVEGALDAPRQNLRAGSSSAAADLAEATRRLAADTGVGEQLAGAAEAIDFPPS